MAVLEPMDLSFRLKFEAAIQDHVAKKATTKRAKSQARERAQFLRERARALDETHEPETGLIDPKPSAAT